LLVNDALVWTGSKVCGFLHWVGAVQGRLDACGDPRGMVVFGGAVLLFGAIVVIMLSVMGRGIGPN
jgi:hypothetical protein